MNINSTENTNQNLASTNTSSQKKDYRAQEALSKGLEEKEEECQDIKIELDGKTKKEVQTIAMAFGLKWDLIIQIAINYAAFYGNKKGFQEKYISNLLNDEDVQTQDNSGQKTIIKIKETVDLTNNLKALNRQDKPIECVKMGIALLYKNNCELKENNKEN